MPYSGPASAYGTIGKAQAYFKKINDEGGINGAKINLITLDDGYSPPKPSSRCASSSNRTKWRSVPDTGHAQQHGDPQVCQRQEGAASLRGHGRDQVERPEELSRGPSA